MSNMYLYADKESREILLNEQQKIISVGSDFGYGNFGDIAQHINSLNFVKKFKKFATVSVMLAEAIGFKDYPSWARGVYGNDAIIFISDYPLIFDEESPELSLVGDIRNIAAVHMYGGGFLNGMWGDAVLAIVEYFLRIAPQSQYFVSGQQVTPPYHLRLLRHLEKFKPVLFSVRDENSYKSLKEIGFDPHFSFDDATELLCQIKDDLSLKNGPGFLMHLNVSDYTANDFEVKKIGDELDLISEAGKGASNVTMFQAFRDPRYSVLDTLETLKPLDQRFPFNDFRVIELPALLYEAKNLPSTRPIVGEMGYSCSYHVALFLQLAGIPCWLRSSNSFYNQKSEALQVSQNFESFLNNPRLADHSLNVERRYQWLSLFERLIGELPEVRYVSHVLENKDGPDPWPFFFKGKPTVEGKLKIALEEKGNLHQQVNRLVAENKEIEIIPQLRMQIDGFREQLTAVGYQAHQYRQHAEAMQVQMAHMAHMAKSDACGPDDFIEIQRLADMQAQINQLLQSRSWKITRPLRAIARFFAHGHFDSNGEVGLYALLQRIGRRLPISAEWRSHIGKFLSKFRR